MRPGTCSLRSLLAYLSEERQRCARSGQPFKLALALSGGGARGVYTAGVLEAWLRLSQEMPGALPDLLVGTSAGAIAGFGFWLDLLYPFPAAQPNAIQPNAASQLYRSRQAALWRRVASHNDGAAQLFGHKAWLLHLVTHKQQAPKQHEQEHHKPLWTAISGDLARLGARLAPLATAESGGLSAPPTLPAEAGSVQETVDGLVKSVGELFFGRLAPAQLMAGAAPGASDQVGRRLSAAWRLRDHLLDQSGLEAALAQLLAASGCDGAATTNPDRALHARVQAAGAVELLVTGADLTAERQLVFAMARAGTLAQLADQGVATVDLSHSVALTDAPLYHGEAFRASHGTTLAAVLTSAAIPVCFPPRRWTLTDGKGTTRHWVVDDGGEPPPAAIARLAGATHVISLELTPLDDAPPRALPHALPRAFPRPAAVPVWRLAPQMPAAAPALAGSAEPRQRLSVDTFDLDGAYDGESRLVMSLYDWFMRGYLDASAFASFAAAADDPIVADYLAEGVPGSTAATRVAVPGAVNAFRLELPST